MKKKVVTMLLAFLLAVTPFFTNGIAKADSIDNEVSVALKYYTGNPTSVNVTVRGKYKILENPNVMLEEGYEYTVSYDSASGSIVLYRGSKKLIATSSIHTIPVKYGLDNYIRINGRAYLGDMNFKPESSKYVRPVNKLPMEDYLKGVVPGEMPPSWDVEALKAQAVAARTYAMSKIDMTIDDTVNYQRYDGYSWWDAKLANSTQAVNESKGHFLKSNGKLITAFYSSSNGGSTENNANLWGGVALSYLPAQKDPYDPVNSWDLKFSQQQINISSLDLTKPGSWWNSVSEFDTTVANNVKTWIKSNGYSNKDIKLVSIDKVTVNPEKTSGDRRISGGYRLKFFVKNEDGSFRSKNGEIELVTIGKEDIGIATLRYMFGTLKFKSHIVDQVSLDNGQYLIKGRGFGHGIGMSQYGAFEMAKAGKGYQEILDFYYPTTTNENYIYNSIQNIQGLNRYETSAAIADFGWTDTDAVVLGRGDNSVDALSGSVLAKKVNAPLLLTKTNELPAEVEQSLDKYRPGTIYILGGVSAVSAEVEKQLKDEYTSNVIRISGSNRHETSVKVAQQVDNASHIIITSNQSDSPDALSIASYAGTKQMPILYTSQSKLESSIADFIKNENVQKVTIIGGDSAVSLGVEDDIQAIVGAGNVDRIAGANRYETSVEIVKAFDLDPKKLFFARGEEFIDALPGSVLAATMQAPIILVGRDKLPESVEQYLNSTYTYIPAIHFLGGSSAISVDTRNQIISEVLH
ncbi:SpoIID/LytB domain-containing protein [Bacillus salacetis]|uniref:SpoIID/LytB domain-containing protein n=1 Tax=Bacillus salacetis TaxID=2315464 RepID=UPI003BA25EA8